MEKLVKQLLSLSEKMENKKSVMDPVISVFVLVLIVSILAGLTFLFVTALKTNVVSTTTKAYSVINESGAYVNSTGYTLAQSTQLEFGSPVITEIANFSDGYIVLSANATVSDAGVVTNSSDSWPYYVNISYTYNAIQERTAYDAVNDTEGAGAQVVSYLPLIFLAIIFGAVLTLALKIVLPYINLGNQIGGF